MEGSRNSFHPIPLGVWGGRRGGKEIKEMEMGEIVGN